MTITLPMSDSQLRASDEHLANRRDHKILVIVALALLVPLAFTRITGTPSSEARALFWWTIAAVVVVVTIAIALTERSYRRARRERRVNRTIGEMRVDVSLNDEGPDFWFVSVDGRDIAVARDMPLRQIGAIDYLAGAKEGLAVWDRDGVLAWTRAGYRPMKLDPDSMRKTG